MQPFEDEFDGHLLQDAWAWEDPAGGSGYGLGGALRFLVAEKAGQGPTLAAAPRLLKRQQGFVWTIETQLSSNTGGGATLTGLTVFKDAANWLVWGQRGNASLEARGLINGSPTGAIGVMATKYPHLRIRRAGDFYFFDASGDGHNWTNANVFVDRGGSLAGARIGMAGTDWSRSGHGGYVASYEYFRESAFYQPPSFLVGSTVKIAQQTGAVAQTAAVDVCGTDYGISFDWLDRTFVAFGETLGCQNRQVVRSQTLAFSSDRAPQDGLTFDGWVTDASGRARELFPDDTPAASAIPTGAIAVGDRAYIFYMQVTNFGASSVWTCDGSSIASAAAADPHSWTAHSGSVSWAPGGFNQLAVLREGSTLYVFGVPCGRFGSVSLMKVAEASVLDKSAYRYFAGFEAGERRWSASEAEAVTVAGGPVGELSVSFNSYLGRYVMAYLDPKKAAIVIREAPLPWGPWSAPTPIASAAQFPRLYAPFMKPGVDQGGGETIYYMMSQFGAYNVFWMKTTLIRAP